jgi:hypothetical protein
VFFVENQHDPALNTATCRLRFLLGHTCREENMEIIDATWEGYGEIGNAPDARGFAEVVYFAAGREMWRDSREVPSGYRGNVFLEHEPWEEKRYSYATWLDATALLQVQGRYSYMDLSRAATELSWHVRCASEDDTSASSCEYIDDPDDATTGP